MYQAQCTRSFIKKKKKVLDWPEFLVSYHSNFYGVHCTYDCYALFWYSLYDGVAFNCFEHSAFSLQTTFHHFKVFNWFCSEISTYDGHKLIFQSWKILCHTINTIQLRYTGLSKFTILTLVMVAEEAWTSCTGYFTRCKEVPNNHDRWLSGLLMWWWWQKCFLGIESWCSCPQPVSLMIKPSRLVF